MKYKYNDQWYPLSALVSLGTTIVRGSITLEAGNTYVEETINYPAGFEYNNSRVLAPSYSFSSERLVRLQGDEFTVQEKADNTLVLKYEINEEAQEDIVIYYDLSFVILSSVLGAHVNEDYSESNNDTYSCAYLNEAISESGGGITQESDPTVPSYVKNITTSNINSWNNKSDFSGDYNDLTNKPTIPSAVTESTISGWGFTKNVGTITGIMMNGSNKGTSGTVNLGTVITSHQDISGKLDTSKVKNTNSTTAGDVYDVRYINTMLGNIESLLSGV